MDKKMIKVLKPCIENARSGKKDINVFDLMYETSLAYPELKVILDKLVLKKELAEIDIKTYKFIGDINRKFDFDKGIIENSKSTRTKNDSDEDELFSKLYNFELAKEFIARTQAEEDDRDDIDDEKEIDENELRYRALKLVIEKGTASVSMFQRSFPVGYIRSCKLIDWMENMGYITASDGAKPRKVLVTYEDFNKIYNEPNCEEEILFDNIVEDEEDEAELDKKFEEYERYLQSHLSENGELEDNANEEDAMTVFEDSAVNSDETQNGQMEEIIIFFKNHFQKLCAIKPLKLIPKRSSWDNENDFMRFCAERILALVKSDKKMGRQDALKKAKVLLEDARKTENKKIIEVYESIVFELQNMTNYYYNKLREKCLSII